MKAVTNAPVRKAVSAGNFKRSTAGSAPSHLIDGDATAGSLSRSTEFQPDPQSPGGVGRRPGKPSFRARAQKNGGTHSVVGQAGPAGPGHHSRQRKQQSEVLSQAGNEPGSDKTSSTAPFRDLSPSEKEAIVQQHWQDGRSVRWIAHHLGMRNRNTVGSIVRRLQAKGAADPRTFVRPPTLAGHGKSLNPFWLRVPEEEKLRLIVERVNADKSHDEVGKEFGLTPGGVKAIVARARQAGIYVKHRNPGRPKGPQAFNIGHRITTRAKAKGVYIGKKVAFDPIPGTTPMPYGSPGCKWAVDGILGKGMLWCGCERLPMRPYCASHEALSRAPERRAA